ncbi:hypothetical protein SmJEL517_g04843 [Synchytrium microbalum]|uniref:C2H2-type domain-containing protein n=1 Tax=Synchytrium microbalum TaxID=1806994 RepID=A0A507C317_9FUNG|nr:uncharacterized protein SmJEL517_g04843 [Synchytrium microbalum]TPX31935.1 hypothetical protein SmJEL517_g04843 [Synchytrium microbalum]
MVVSDIFKHAELNEYGAFGTSAGGILPKLGCTNDCHRIGDSMLPFRHQMRQDRHLDATGCKIQAGEIGTIGLVCGSCIALQPDPKPWDCTLASPSTLITNADQKILDYGTLASSTSQKMTNLHQQVYAAPDSYTSSTNLTSQGLPMTSQAPSWGSTNTMASFNTQNVTMAQLTQSHGSNQVNKVISPVNPVSVPNLLSGPTNDVATPSTLDVHAAAQRYFANRTSPQPLSSSDPKHQSQLDVNSRIVLPSTSDIYKTNIYDIPVHRFTSNIPSETPYTYMPSKYAEAGARRYSSTQDPSPIVASYAVQAPTLTTAPYQNQSISPPPSTYASTASLGLAPKPSGALLYTQAPLVDSTTERYYSPPQGIESVLPSTVPAGIRLQTAPAQSAYVTGSAGMMNHVSPLPAGTPHPMVHAIPYGQSATYAPTALPQAITTATIVSYRPTIPTPAATLVYSASIPAQYNPNIWGADATLPPSYRPTSTVKYEIPVGSGNTGSFPPVYMTAAASMTPSTLVSTDINPAVYATSYNSPTDAVWSQPSNWPYLNTSATNSNQTTQPIRQPSGYRGYSSHESSHSHEPILTTAHSTDGLGQNPHNVVTIHNNTRVNINGPTQMPPIIQNLFAPLGNPQSPNLMLDPKTKLPIYQSSSGGSSGETTSYYDSEDGNYDHQKAGMHRETHHHHHHHHNNSAKKKHVEQSEKSSSSNSSVKALIPEPLVVLVGDDYRKRNESKRKYLCDVCKKRFTRPSSLKTHMHSHTGERPFVCLFDNCSKRFSVLSNLRRHEKTCTVKTPSQRASYLIATSTTDGNDSSPTTSNSNNNNNSSNTVAENLFDSGYQNMPMTASSNGSSATGSGDNSTGSQDSGGEGTDSLDAMDSGEE